MEDWEKEDFDPQVLTRPLVNPDRWEGEDEDDDVKDNWDDEEEEKKEEQTVVAVQPKKKKTLAQALAEKEEKKRRELEERRRKMEEEEDKVSNHEDALAEKLRQQKLQEEADLELAKETFGVTETSDIVDHMQPSSKEDFENFRKALVSKISKHEGSPHYILFIEELCRDLSLTLQPDDIKKITISLNAIATEKIKAQKAAKGKKKSKKATLNLGKNDLTIMNTYEDEFDDYI